MQHEPVQIQKDLSEGVQLWQSFFQMMRARGSIQISLKVGHLIGVWLVGRWWQNIECWLGSFVILQGIQTSIANKPYIFVIFQWGGGGGSRPPVPPPPSGSAHDELDSINSNSKIFLQGGPIAYAFRNL